MVRCALVCITKNDQLYLEEYIRYYLKLGFDTIFLYDNSDKNDLKTWDRGGVRVIWYPGKGRQISAYNHFLSRHKNGFDYVAFFDSDEFLVLKKHSCIGEFCRDHIKEGALGINWYIFGNNGHTSYQDSPVVQRFTKRDSGMHPLVKTIARCSDIEQMLIHKPHTLSRGRFKNCRQQEIESPENTDWDDSLAQLNHYCTKSDEEYGWKVKRGRGAIQIKRKYHELESYLYLNIVQDNSAFDFFQGICSKKCLAVVLFSSQPDLIRPSFSPKTCYHLFVYSDLVIPTDNHMIEEETYILQNRFEYQQHFLTYFKTSFEHVLFIEPGERIEVEGTDMVGFCLDNLKDGVCKIRSKEKEGHRLLAKCNDLLEIQDYQIQKMGYGVSVQETDKLFFS